MRSEIIPINIRYGAKVNNDGPHPTLEDAFNSSWKLYMF